MWRMSNIIEKWPWLLIFSVTGRHYMSGTEGLGWSANRNPCTLKSPLLFFFEIPFNRNRSPATKATNQLGSNAMQASLTPCMRSSDRLSLPLVIQIFFLRFSESRRVSCDLDASKNRLSRSTWNVEKKDCCGRFFSQKPLHIAKQSTCWKKPQSLLILNNPQITRRQQQRGGN